MSFYHHFSLPLMTAHPRYVLVHRKAQIFLFQCHAREEKRTVPCLHQFNLPLINVHAQNVFVPCKMKSLAQFARPTSNIQKWPLHNLSSALASIPRHEGRSVCSVHSLFVTFSRFYRTDQPSRAYLFVHPEIKKSRFSAIFLRCRMTG